MLEVLNIIDLGMMTSQGKELPLGASLSTLKELQKNRRLGRRRWRPYRRCRNSEFKAMLSLSRPVPPCLALSRPSSGTPPSLSLSAFVSRSPRPPLPLFGVRGRS